MKFRQPRRPEDLRNDPKFDYMVGRLLGTAEMLTYYLALHGDEQGQQMADRASHNLAFFFEGDRGPLPELPSSAVPPAARLTRRPDSDE